MAREENCFNIEVMAQVKRYKKAAQELENSKAHLADHGVKIDHTLEDGEIKFTMVVDLEND